MSKDKRVGYQTPNGRNFQLNSSGYKWNVDCASFVFYALYYTGYLNGSPRDPFGTDEETAVLKANGFVEVSLSSRKRGDILLVKRNERNTGYGHTAIYIGENLLIDAATNYDGKGRGQLRQGSCHSLLYGGQVQALLQTGGHLQGGCTGEYTVCAAFNSVGETEHNRKIRIEICFLSHCQSPDNGSFHIAPVWYTNLMRFADRKEMRGFYEKGFVRIVLNVFTMIMPRKERKHLA